MTTEVFPIGSFGSIPDGVWPTMITPFTEDGAVDYDSLERLVEWYIERQVDGLFAVCQSSEMFALSLEERAAVAEFVVKRSAGRVPVIASGHISDDFDAQVEELNRIAQTGIDGLVLVTNRIAAQHESDADWIRGMERLLGKLPGSVPLGMYECPYPYKRLLTPEQLKWCAGTGRFRFLKDTCCDAAQLDAKLQAVRGTELKIFNANSATLLKSLQLGAAGFSGVMANFHPELYVWLTRNHADRPAEAEKLMSMLGVASFIEKQVYPVNAKYHLMLEGVAGSLRCRVRDAAEFTATNRLEVEQLRRLTSIFSESFPLGG